MEKIKVLHIINSLAAGGAEKLVSQIVPILNEDKRFEVELLLLTKEDNVFLPSVLHKNVKVYYSEVNKPRSLKNIKYIIELIRLNNYNVIHSHLFPDFYWASFASLFVDKSIKFIVTEHNTTNRRRNIPFYNLVEKVIYNRFDAMIAISDETQAELLSWIGTGGRRSKKSHTIYNGIDVDHFKNCNPLSPSSLISSYKEEDLLLCMVGRFAEQKDQKTLIKSLVHLDSKIKLILVGDGPKKEELMLLTEELNLDDRVSFLGFRQDINRIYKTCDLAVISSNWEGFGLVAVEGMASGLPTVGSNVSGLSGVIGKENLLFKKNDEKDLARVINQLLSSDMEYIKAKQYCEQRASNFTIESMVSQYKELYITKINGGSKNV